ncbi:MAG: hypothetical protein AAF467_03220 [Actinomycetota bacterium]
MLVPLAARMSAVRLAAVLFAPLVALGGCATDEATDDVDDGTGPAPAADGAVVDPDVDIAAIIEDVNDYWVQADEALGFEFVPVPLDRITTGDDGVLCNGREIDPDEVAGNAFVDLGCEEGLLIAYDPAYVTSSVATAEMTFAHEWGHVIQAQAEQLDLSLDPDGLPIDGELQADCFAGAWATERAEADLLSLRRDVRSTGDESDVDLDDPDAHGTAGERLEAFELGFEGGPQSCVLELPALLPG